MLWDIKGSFENEIRAHQTSGSTLCVSGDVSESWRFQLKQGLPS